MSLHPLLALDHVIDEYRDYLRPESFSHRAKYPNAPELCLAKFDELHAIGLDAFTKKYDPYWDIPLNENLAQPVIDIPIPVPADRVGEQHGFYLTRRDADVNEDRPAVADPPVPPPSRARWTGGQRRRGVRRNS